MQMRYSFCPKCGGRLALNEAGDETKPYCTACGFVFYQNPAVGVAAIVIREQKILLGRRKGGEYEEKWCIPCGYVEWNEDVYEAACREFMEETGLSITIQGVYTVHSNFHNPSQHTVGIWFMAEEAGGELRAGDDLNEVGFFEYDELPELAFPTDRLVLEQLKQENMLL